MKYRLKDILYDDNIAWGYNKTTLNIFHHNYDIKDINVQDIMFRYKDFH